MGGGDRGTDHFMKLKIDPTFRRLVVIHLYKEKKNIWNRRKFQREIIVKIKQVNKIKKRE